MGYILSIDQGTTGSTAVLINDKDFSFVGKVNHEFKQIFPKPSWVEHDLGDIWGSIKQTTIDVLKKYNIKASEVSSIGITNQRETTCAFNKSGAPLANAIVWQDRRTGDFCNDLKGKNLESLFKEKTGLPIDAYFSGTKMAWLLKNNSEVQVAYKNNDLRFGTIDTFILHKLTAGASYYTEASNASRTLLMNLRTCEWDQELLDILEVSKKCLPEIKDSFTQFGQTKDLDFLPDGIPITGILGDQQSALFGQAGINKGDMKCTYGTGAFMLLNTGDDIQYSDSGLLTTLAYKHNGKAVYALEGSCYIAGACVQWLRDKLSIFETSPQVEALASKVTNLDEMEHLLMFPFFTGIGSPYWISDAKACLWGMTRDTSIEHLSLAALDGIALSINDLINAMKKDTGLEIKTLKVDGGAAINRLLLEIQSTISNLQIIRPQIIETTAYGAAMAAAIGNSTIDFKDIENLWNKDIDVNPIDSKSAHYKKKQTQWTDLINKLYVN